MVCGLPHPSAQRLQLRQLNNQPERHKATMNQQQHNWNDQFCSCGQDAVTCQGCGKPVCADVALRKADADDPSIALAYGPCCWAKEGLGHAGKPCVRRQLVVTGWDAQSKPIYRYRDELNLADHLRERPTAEDIAAHVRYSNARPLGSLDKRGWS